MVIIKDRPKVVISVSAETEITPKVTIYFRPKTETETENACDLPTPPAIAVLGNNKITFNTFSFNWFVVNFPEVLPYRVFLATLYNYLKQAQHPIQKSSIRTTRSNRETSYIQSHDTIN